MDLIGVGLVQMQIGDKERHHLLESQGLSLLQGNGDTEGQQVSGIGGEVVIFGWGRGGDLVALGKVQPHSDHLVMVLGQVVQQGVDGFVHQSQLVNHRQLQVLADFVKLLLTTEPV